MNNHNRLIREFVKTAQRLDAVEIFVRSDVVAKAFGVSKFFSIGHTHLAVFVDELDNMTILTNTGTVKQLITEDEILKALNSVPVNHELQVLTEYGSNILIAVVEDKKRVVEYVLSNQETGSTHTLAGEYTPRERLIAHWEGFVNSTDVDVQVVQFENKKPFLPYYNTMKELNEKIKEVRKFECYSGVIRRRETEIIFMADGERDGETNWEGTKSDLLSVITTNLKLHPEIDEIYVSGGYDASDSVDDYDHGAYEPQCHMWDVLVWKKKTNFAPFDWILL